MTAIHFQHQYPSTSRSSDDCLDAFPVTVVPLNLYPEEAE